MGLAALRAVAPGVRLLALASELTVGPRVGGGPCVLRVCAAFASRTVGSHALPPPPAVVYRRRSHAPPSSSSAASELPPLTAIGPVPYRRGSPAAVTDRIHKCPSESSGRGPQRLTVLAALYLFSRVSLSCGDRAVGYPSISRVSISRVSLSRVKRVPGLASPLGLSVECRTPRVGLADGLPLAVIQQGYP